MRSGRSKQYNSTSVNQSFKKWLFIGAGFGAGAVLLAVLVIGGVAWYSSRPKAWNGDAIRASFSTDLWDVDDNFNVTAMEVEYVLENKTANDYTLSPDQTFMIVDRAAMGPSVSGKYKIDHSCFIPAGNRVKCSVTVPADYDTSFSVEGFVVFDSASRYKVVFPKPLRPTPEDKKKNTEHFMKLKSEHSQSGK